MIPKWMSDRKPHLPFGSPRQLNRQEWEAVVEEITHLRGQLAAQQEEIRKLKLKLDTVHLDPELQRNLYERGETR